MNETEIPCGELKLTAIRVHHIRRERAEVEREGREREGERDYQINVALYPIRQGDKGTRRHGDFFSMSPCLRVSLSYIFVRGVDSDSFAHFFSITITLTAAASVRVSWLRPMETNDARARESSSALLGALPLTPISA